MKRIPSPGRATATVRRQFARWNHVPRLQKFNDFLAQAWPGLIRSKGHFWLAKRPGRIGELSLAGGVCRTEAMGL